MSTKTISLLPHESSALAAGKLGVLIRVVEPQPEISLPDGRWYWDGRLYDSLDAIKREACPFGPPGTVLECREEWAETESEGGPVMAYRAGGYLMIGATGSKKAGTWQESTFPGNAGEVYPPEEWQPADSMPSWAIRFRPVVGEVRCVRVRDVTLKEWDAWGCDAIIDPLVNHPLRDSVYEIGEWHQHGDYEGEGEMYAGLIEAAQVLFNSIHGEGSWDADPWVWLATINREGE